MKALLVVLTTLSLLCWTGCDRNAAAEKERRERTNALFADAVLAADRGDVTSAKALYGQILAQDPTNSTAHLNMAMLLHDYDKDYLSAIVYYRQYLALQPDSEKAAMVKGRESAAHTLFISTLEADITAKAQAELKKELADAVTKNTALAHELKMKTAEVEALKSEVKELRRLVDALRTAEKTALRTAEESGREISRLKNSLAEEKAKQVAAKTTHTVSDARQEVEQLKVEMAAIEAEEEINEDESSAMINSIRQDMADLKREDPKPEAAQPVVQDDSARKAAEAARKAAEAKQAEQNEQTRSAAEGQQDSEMIASTPTAGQKYLVRPGDTLSKLSREAYGSSGQWKRIRDANRSTTNPDGRLRAGEVILIP